MIRFLKRKKETSEPKIKYPDVYAKAYIEYSNRMIDDPEGYQDHIGYEISRFFPEEVDYDLAEWIYMHTISPALISCRDNGMIRDEYYHVAHSRYALLDLTICSYFERRVYLCMQASLHDKRREVDWMDALFFEFLPKYFKEHLGFSEEEVNAIVDRRLSEYEEVMRTATDATSWRRDLRTWLRIVLARDFSGSPMTRELHILSIDQDMYLTAETEGAMNTAKSFYMDDLPDCLL